MENNQRYSAPHTLRPGMEFMSQMPPPPHTLPPDNAHYQLHGHIPYSSSFQGQEPPPPLPTPGHDAFQSNIRSAESAFNPSSAPSGVFHNHRSAESAFDTSSAPSGTFHDHRFVSPDFSRPPPFHNYGNNTSQSDAVRQQQVNRTPSSQDFRPHYAMPSQNYEFSALPRSAAPGGHCSQPTFEPPRGFVSHIAVDSSHTQSTSEPFETSLDAAAKSKEKDEQMWLANFEQKILGRVCWQPSKNVTSEKKPLKLIEVQHMVSQSESLTAELCQLKDKMELQKKDVPDQHWYELVDRAENIKMELNDMMLKFQDEKFIEDVQRSIQQRRKKRERKKRQHKMKIRQKKELEETWKKEEEKIDTWMEKLRLKEEDKRREAAIKTEADSILGEVRQKQIDGVKMQQLLENLISLRIARLNKGAAHGFISTPQQDLFFNTTIKNIREVVDAQMEEYKLEEQTLRVMMEESTSYQRTSAGKELRDINKLESAVKKLLFGDVAPIDQETYSDYTAADHCLDTLIQRRSEWDQFICKDNIPMASSVPLTWVIPPTKPSSAWQQYQL